MNEGLNQHIITPADDDDQFSGQWWRDTKRMIKEGERKFWRKRKPPHRYTMRDQIRASHKQSKARRAARRDEL